MCGICGYINPSGFDPVAVARMAQRAAHRGPDGEGYWLWQGGEDHGRLFEKPATLPSGPQLARAALGHKRLAIIDLSHDGLQPMGTVDETSWIVLNGEIYNYIEIRQDLERRGHQFRTRTDTEVALLAYREWGPACFPRFNGMWGIAIVDLSKRSLILSRDRLGEKPLYVWCDRGALAFASEIKQFLDLPGFSPRLNEDAVAEFVDTGYEAPPQTFFKGVAAFPPGHWASIALDAPSQPVPIPYWMPDSIQIEPMNEHDAVERFRTLFAEAVAIRLRSDVPVGTCLSGGLDSSAIYLQAAQLQPDATPHHAFSAFFEDPRFDERKYVTEVLSRTISIGHHVFPTPERFIEEHDAFLFQHDEPPASLSMFASFCVMRLARERGVPVLLSGQGGDELFGGYWPAYLLWLRTTLATRPMKFAEQVLRMVLPGGNREIFRQLLPHWRQYRSREARSHRCLLRPAYRDAGFTLNRNWALEAQSLSPTAYRLSEIRRVHLPRLLKWEDRNSMAHGIEVRYPFLDHRLVDWGVSVPPALNFQQGWNKWIVRQALADMLPPAIRFRRNKIGFETPQSSWIRHQLRPLLSSWVANPSERFRAIVDVPGVQALLRQAFDRRREVPHLDESHLLLVRLYFLDRWLCVFNVASGVSA